MTPRHDIKPALPEAPPPSPEVRERTLATALRQFDASGRQGSGPEPRLREVETSWRPIMTRARTALAASLVLAVAAPAAVWVARDLANEASAPKPPVEATPATRSDASPPAPESAGQAAPSTEATVPTMSEPANNEPSPTASVAPAAPAAPQPIAPPLAEAPQGLAQAETGSTQRQVAARDGAGAPSPVARPSVAPPSPRRAEADTRTRSMAFAPSGLPDAQRPPAEPVGRDRFAGAAANGFQVVREAPVSTFSIDVDTASYSFTRASLNRNALPQPASVRTEELVNYFPYDYDGPATAAEPFRTHVAVYPSPWAEGRKIMRIGVKGYAVQPETRPRANLVFLIDTSGSMNAPNRMPLVKQSLSMLVGQLDSRDRVAIVAYAGAAGTVLEPTSAADKGRILAAIETLQPGGGTAGGEGIRQAYALAERNLDPAGVNRVVLATDGDFNVGITDREEFKGFVERERGKGVFLSVLGFGMGNYNDALMQALAQNGNGAAAYIDTLAEARKVLVEEATSTLIPIAKDVKIQVEFNPAAVSEYRLIGYETRLLAREDFNNDKVDAGDVGSGQSVTALYEIVPVGGARAVGDLRYGERGGGAAPGPTVEVTAGEYAFVQLRYKLPRSEQSELRTTPVARAAERARFEDAPTDARFATAVAAFGEILRGGRHTGRFGFEDVLRIAAASRGDDPFGYRSEFLQLVRAAKTASAMAATRR